MRFTISNKILLFLIFPGLLIFGVFMYYSIANTEAIMYSLHQKNFEEKVRGYADLADTYLTQTSNNAKYNAKIITEFSKLSKDEMFSLLFDNIEQAEIIFGSTIAFEPNKYYKSKKNFALFAYRLGNGKKRDVISYDYTQPKYEWYNIPKKTLKPYWTEPYYSDVIEGLKLVSYCVPIIKNGKFIGVTTIDYSLKTFDDIFQKEFEHKTTQFAIITHKGQYISHPNQDKILEGNIFDKVGLQIEWELREKIGERMISGESGFIEQKDSTNQTLWGFYAPIPISNWSIVVYVYEEELNGPIKEVFYRSILIFVITLTSSLFLLVFLVRKGIKPLLKLQDFSKQIIYGNYGVQIKIDNNDEIGDLAEDLNTMSEELDKRSKELIEINENLEKKVEERTLELKIAKESTDEIIDNSPIPITVIEKNTGKVLRANTAMAQFHKIELEELYNSSAVDWYWDKSERQKVLEIVEKKGKIISYQIEGKRIGTGEKRWALISIFPIEYLNKEALIVEMSDITEIKEANIKIKSQNLEISARNRYISESISYAQKIQTSILPSDEFIKTIIPDYFLIYKPKDIVSGDFYWVQEIENKKIVAVIDCTGHGVPGALMSMIGNTLLNEIVYSKKITNPAEILNMLNQRVIEELKKDVSKSTYDGMDVALCVIDETNKTLKFSGAYRSLSYFKNNQLYEIKGVRKSIGDIKKKNTLFTSEKIDLNESVVIYLYSDGFIDQNNTNGKKLGSVRFKEILSAIYDKDINEQKEILLAELKKHQGDEIQRDDITLLGLKLSSNSSSSLREIIFNYEGEFKHQKIIELSEKIEEIVVSKFDKKAARTVHFCGIELMQNIAYYSEEKEESGVGSFEIIQETPTEIILRSSNLISHNSYNKFAERIDEYNLLTPEELKELYKEKLKSEPEQGSKGANIGLIQILRKTKNKINYFVKKKSEDNLILFVEIKITLS